MTDDASLPTAASSAAEKSERRASLVAELSSRIEKLDEHTVAQTAEVSMLRYEVQEERHKRHVLWAVVVALGMVIVAVSAGAGLLGYVALQNRRTLVEVQKTNRTLVECTTPGNPNAADPADRVHECYNRLVTAAEARTP